VSDQIVDFMNQQQPMIKATRFIGQGTDKKGGKGFDQKLQQTVCSKSIFPIFTAKCVLMLFVVQTIKRFKAGDFNTLVATSIGEEGLDIGEVDLIICYEAQKSPIRMVCTES
jgi:ATP-dependent DNA helicase MPH1